MKAAPDPFTTAARMFGGYPFAVDRTDDPDSGSMILTVPDSTVRPGARFYEIDQTPARRGRGTWYELFARNQQTGEPDWDSSVKITRDGCSGGTAADTDRVLTSAMPLPSTGSMFGFVSGAFITELMYAFDGEIPDEPWPGWGAYPFESAPRDQWAGLEGKQFWETNFWDLVKTGVIVRLDDVITGNPGTFYWTKSTAREINHGIVTRATATATGAITIRPGRYIFDENLTAGRAVPQVPLSECADLAERF